MSFLSKEDQQLLHDFHKHFEVRVHSMGSQAFSVNPDGYGHYEDLEIYGDTSIMEILYNGEVIYKIEEPRNDVEALMNYVRAWDMLGRPLPDKEKNINIVVEIEHGLVLRVLSDQKATVRIVDYDVDGLFESEYNYVNGEPAYIYEQIKEAEVDPEAVTKILKECKKEDI